MSQSEDTTAQTASLTSHERKPIHLPGSIQPHGVLLGLNTELEIIQVSNNTQDYFGKEPVDLLGQPLSYLLHNEQVEAIAHHLQKSSGNAQVFKVSINTQKGKQNFDAIAHRTEDAAILELEPTALESEVSFLGFHALLGDAIAQMQETSNLTEFLQRIAEKLRKITEFDRIMVYQFDQQGSGAVIAEAKREDLHPYLGLNYPATDIPQESRELYRRGLLRFIPDLNAQSVELIPVENSQLDQTDLENKTTNFKDEDNPKSKIQNPKSLDLSLCVLRSVDSCCVQFHQNMGVAALLVIALIKDQKLWGLISCHHQTPKHLPYEVRKICEFLGQIVSLELAHKVSHSEWDYGIKLKSLQSEFIESISQADNFIDALIKPEIRLLGLVSATGAAVCLDQEITLVGEAPEVEQVRSLIEWADTQVNDNLFSTDSLPKLYPEALAFKDTASGLLLLRISKVRRYYILWFRPEVIQTVNWAGNPQESINIAADGSVILCPRTSFVLWQETVRLTSLTWQECELESALALKNAIVGIVLSKAEELAKINLELERSNRELASFAFAASHDLKEPLRGIYNYSTILLEDYAHVLDDEGVDCLQTVQSLSVRMETLINALLRLSQLGQAQLHLKDTDLNELLNQVVDVFHASRQDSQLHIRIPRPLPTIQCDPVLVNEVFSNLLVNAFKYNDKPEQWVEIGFLDSADDKETDNWHFQAELRNEANQSPAFYVRDNGIGIQAHHFQTIFRLFKRLHSQEKYGGGAGAGLAIAKRIIERHGGQIWVESTVGEGSTFYFTLA